jgi:hypothetical protein
MPAPHPTSAASRSTGAARPRPRVRNGPHALFIAGILLFVLLGIVRTVYSRVNSAMEVQTVRVKAINPAMLRHPVPWS